MKSRISIDVAEDNQPIIKIEYRHSDDVRDKLIKRFLENIDEGSEVGFRYTDNVPGGCNSELRPYPVDTLEYQYPDNIISNK